jgi:hypothetical protein
MCLVLYFAMLTGFGLSVSSAAHIRVLLVVMCATSLVFLVVKRLIALRSPPAQTQ